MAAHQAPPSLGFSSQEHWSGLPFPSPMHETKEKGEKWLFGQKKYNYLWNWVQRKNSSFSLRQHILMWWRWHSWSQWVVQLDMSLHWNGGTMPRHSSLSLHHRGHYHGDMWFSQDDNQKTHFHILKKMELCVFQKIHHKFWCSSWALDYYCQVDNVMASILFLV